jgi:hypothetical protein
MNVRLESIEASVNELFRKTGRPRADGYRDDVVFERKVPPRCAALGTCLKCRRSRRPSTFNSAQIDEAIAARRGFKSLIRHRDMNKLDAHECKSLSAFSFGTNHFPMAPEMSNQVLSCLADPSDLSGPGEPRGNLGPLN